LVELNGMTAGLAAGVACCRGFASGGRL